MIENKLKICTKNVIELLLDKEWHDLYEPHSNFNIRPSELLASLDILLKHEIIELDDDQSMRLKANLNNKQVSFINDIYKTRKPESLRQTFLDK